MTTRVAVIGADGFVGRAVVDALKRSDWATPVAIGRRQVGAAGSAVERRQLDATDAPALARALEDVGAAVNCVLGSATTMVDGGRALFGIADLQPLRIVHLSSMAVYGPVVGEVAETAPLSGAESDYAQAKVELERLAAGRPTVTVFRPGIIYGPGGEQWSGQVARWLTSRRLGDLGEAGNGRCNLVHVDDVAEATLLALRSDAAAGQAYNLGMAQPPTWNEYFQRYAALLGVTPPVRVSPGRLAVETKIWALPLKFVDRVTTRLGISPGVLPAPISSSMIGLWKQDIRLSVQKAERELGFRGRPLEKGLEETAAAYSRTPAA